jgi:hypothetical protein
VSENRVLKSVFGSSSEAAYMKLMTMNFIIGQKCFDTLSINYRVTIGPYHRSFDNIREYSLSDYFHYCLVTFSQYCVLIIHRKGH